MYPFVQKQADRGDYIVEHLTFQTTPDLRVPACLAIPKHDKNHLTIGSTEQVRSTLIRSLEPRHCRSA